MSGDAPSEGYLASFCLTHEGDPETEVLRLSQFAGQLDRCFRYWELVYVIGESQSLRASRLAAVLSKIRNLRTIVVRDHTNYYRRRAIAASEAIGDVVVLTSFQELDGVDVPAIAERTYETGELVRAHNSAPLAGFSPAHALLQLLAPYRIDSRDLRTLGLPRTRLSWLLSRSTLTLDLRFEAKQGGFRHLREPVRMRAGRHQPLAERYGLLEELITTSAPRLLRAYAVLSTFVAGLALLYGVYAVVVIALKERVQEGWFSTALVQSGSVAFVALGMTVLGIGLADLEERLSDRSKHVIVDELANTNFFDGADRMNVEVSGAAAPSPAPGPALGRAGR